jgi:hypothetical protein
MRKISIGFDLCEHRSYDSFFLRLLYHGAEERLPTEWILLTSLSVGEIMSDLQKHIDPADRLLVTQVTSMSYRNLINNDSVGRGAA